MQELFGTGNVFFQPVGEQRYDGPQPSVLDTTPILFDTLFHDPTVYSFTVPDYVTQFSVVCVGGGGGGTGMPYFTGRLRYQEPSNWAGPVRWRDNSGNGSRSDPNNWEPSPAEDQYPYDAGYFTGGGGGGLSYTNNVACYPGEVFTAIVGAAGRGKYSSVDEDGTTYSVNKGVYGTAGTWGGYTALFRGTDTSNSLAIVCLATGGAGCTEAFPYSNDFAWGGNRTQTAVTINGNTITAVGDAYNVGGDGGTSTGYHASGGGGAAGYSGSGGQGQSGYSGTKGNDGAGGGGGGGGSSIHEIGNNTFGYQIRSGFTHQYNDPDRYDNWASILMPGGGGGGVGLNGEGTSGTGGQGSYRTTYTTEDGGTGIIIGIPKGGTAGSNFYPELPVFYSTDGQNASNYTTYEYLTTEQNPSSVPNLDDGGGGGRWGGGGGAPGLDIDEDANQSSRGCSGEAYEIWFGNVPYSVIGDPGSNTTFSIMTTINQSATYSRGGNGGYGGMKIIWGENRFFPNNYNGNN